MENNYRSLPIGNQLSDYKIEGVLGQGTFGITYLAIDIMLNRKFAIKEYYPREYAVRDGTLKVRAAGSKEDFETFKWGLERFLDEARILARFAEPNIVAVRRFFEANGTAYLVMDYCEGVSLDELVKSKGPLNKLEIDKIFYPLLDGLEKVHKSNFLHRDIKPANIFIKSDGTPVLLDFGAARQEIFSHSKSVTSLATPGYAAFEQYSSNGKQGPWTDIYGLAATLYRAISGKKPQDSPDRILEDTLEPLYPKFCDQFPEYFLKSIDNAMSVRPNDRPQSIRLWRDSLIQITNVEKSLKNKRIEPSLKTEKLNLKQIINDKNTIENNVPWNNVLSIGSVIIFLILVVSFISSSFKNSSVDTKLTISKPTPVPVPNQSEIFQTNNKLTAIEGLWSNLNDCSAFTTLIKTSDKDLGELQLNFQNNKGISYKIVSIDNASNNNFKFSIVRNNEKYELEYSLESDGTLYLLRKIQLLPVRKIIVINGKDFENEKLWDPYKKCQ